MQFEAQKWKNKLAHVSFHNFTRLFFDFVFNIILLSFIFLLETISIEKSQPVLQNSRKIGENINTFVQFDI